MKIVRIIARLNVGGPARHVVWLTKEFNRAEYRSVLVTGMVPEGEEDMEYLAAENEIEPLHIKEMSRELSIKDIVSIWKIYRLICREKPDIICTHTAKAGTVGRISGFAYRWLNWKDVKMVHTFHGHIFHSYYGRLKTNIFILIEKFLAFFATDKIIVLSQKQYDEIHNKYGVGQKGQFHIVPLGIDLEKFSYSGEKRKIFRRELNAENDEILVGFVGRFTEVKNISLFLQTAKFYKEQKNSDSPKLKFVLVGDGHLRRSFEETARTLDIQDIVIFLGNRKDLDVIYGGLDVVAITSLNEGTPLSLIEGMANGKALISTSVGGVSDLFGKCLLDKQNFAVCERGLLVYSLAAEDFYNGLMYLTTNKTLLKKMTESTEYVRNNFSKERLFADIGIVYHQLND